MKKFNNETEGQIYFYDKFLKRVDSNLSQNFIINDNNDGVINGNIIEFKLHINDINSTLFQTIKYLSFMRVKGKSIPANIILVSLNDEIAYIFSSQDYLKDIEKIYVGSASKDNIGFQYNTSPLKINYSNQIEAENLIHILKKERYTKINIDENCIIGWANRYYKERPNSKKSDFIGDQGEVKIVGEIRRPSHFKDLIHPYEGKTNIKFKYLMDKLNDNLSQKNLGAFYTPYEYVKKSMELVKEAISRVPEGHDYIILDRCAGTGNLQQLLSDEELSHCVVSTYEYYEYKVLMELIGDKVRHIIPPFETSEIFDNGNVIGANALSEEYCNNKIIEEYVKDTKCNIIMLENPPYAETTSMSRGKGKKSTFKNEYLFKKMEQALKNNKSISGATKNELANVFIWSAFEYYLKKPDDSYILFSPLKYFKQQHLVEKEFIKGFAFNREHFHANKHTVSCILWGNKDQNNESIVLEAFDINKKTRDLIYEGKIEVKKVYKTIVKTFSSPKGYKITPPVVSDDIGRELKKDNIIRVKMPEGLEYIGYITIDNFGIDSPFQNSRLTRLPKYNGNGMFLTKEDYIYKLPLLAASKYMENISDWKIMGSICKTSDGKDKYLKDIEKGVLDDWLTKVLLWASLVSTSKMLSIKGSDGVYYRNELCLDNTNGETIASNRIKKLKTNDVEENLINQWNRILMQAKTTERYNNDLTYGIYQISEELNTSHKIMLPNGTEKIVYDYPDLNGNLNSLKIILKQYYIEEISNLLFEYGFLK